MQISIRFQIRPREALGAVPVVLQLSASLLLKMHSAIEVVGDCRAKVVRKHRVVVVFLTSCSSAVFSTTFLPRAPRNEEYFISVQSGCDFPFPSTAYVRKLWKRCWLSSLDWWIDFKLLFLSSSIAEIQMLGLQALQWFCGVPWDAAAEVPVSNGASTSTKEDAGR